MQKRLLGATQSVARGITAAVVAVMLAACCAVNASAATPRSFFGVAAWGQPSAADFQTLGAGGIGTFRANLYWSAVERTEGTYDWTYFDAIVGDGAAAGVRVLPTLIGSPPWVSANSLYPPLSAADQQAFGAFAAAAVARYGNGGAFWREHPQLSYLPATAWQVWNEPNFPSYWFNKPNAKQYVTLLKVAAAAIRAADPRAAIVMGGLPESSRGVPIATFLAAIYAVPGAKQAFDVVALHPYAVNQRGVMGAIDRARAVMTRAHDAGSAIWLTELGWSTGGPANPFTTTLGGQAARIQNTLRLLLRNRTRDHLLGVIYFSLRDRALDPGERDWWAPHTGLFDLAGNPKPAWGAYSAIARSG